jgi:hypothetical protein
VEVDVGELQGREAGDVLVADALGAHIVVAAQDPAARRRI